MLLLFQADITRSTGKILTARFLRPNLQSARSLAFAQPRRVRSYLATATAFPTSSARLASARRVMRSAMLIFQGSFVLDLA
jgi:hypothetical protein